MKKSMKLLAILLFVVLMSGCVKYNFSMEVGKDKSVTVEIIDAIDKEYSSYGSQETEAAAAEAKGFTKTEFEDEEWIGYKLTKKYDNIDKISTKSAITVELMDILDSEKAEPTAYFQVKKGLFKTTYVANFTINTADEDAEEEEDTEEDEEESDDGADISYKVVLPVKAGTNDATTVSEDGKTLTWQLEYGKLNTVKYEFSMLNTTMIIVVVAVAVIIGGGVVFVVSKGKKKPNAGGAMPNGMPMNNQPGMHTGMHTGAHTQPMTGPQPNPVDPNPLGAVAPEQPMDNNMFGQPAPEQNFMPAEGMPSLENQPPIVDNQPAPATDFGQPAAFPEVNLEAAPEVAPAEVPPVEFDNNTDTVVMPPVGDAEMAMPAVEPAPMETPEMAVPVIDPNNNNVQ